MTLPDYPVDLHVERPGRSSRGWAALTIVLIKFVALIPHFIVLGALSIAQALVAFVAQVAVTFTGEYPAGMFRFVAGVLRWQTRVGTFALSLNDRYPPFSLEPDDDYPADLVIERPARSSRVYALFTVIVQVIFVAVMVALIVWFAHHPDWWRAHVSGGKTDSRWSPSSSSGGLILRSLAALPHLIVLGFVGIAAIIVWMIAQWVILFRAVYPQGMFEFVAGFLRWSTRVNAYTLGLTDLYPPFSLEPSAMSAMSANTPAVTAADVPASPAVPPPLPSAPPPLPPAPPPLPTEESTTPEGPQA